MQFQKWITLVAFAGIFAANTPADATEVDTVRSATGVLDEIMAAPEKKIPETMLSDAEAIAVVPDVIKGGFVIGARHGKGVVVIRDKDGHWQAPVFITLTGGSVGWQIGVQSTDVILVFKTKRSVENLMRGKFTIGADAAAAAGPVGRQAAAATDGRLKAEIYSYSRSRGLFAGVALDGSVLQVDEAANTLYYFGPAVPRDAAGQVIVDASAGELLERIVKYSATTVAAPGLTAIPDHSPAAPVAAELPTTDALRRQLSDSSKRLYPLLDDAWKRYLALPAEVFEPVQHPKAEILSRVVANYDAVASNQQYQRLTSHPEFQATHQLLRQYAQELARGASPVLDLPPPPQ